MSLASLTCKNCAAPLPIQSRFTGSVSCRYCHTVYILENDALNEIGVVKPFEGYSPFNIGLSGTYKGKAITILGRIRYEDDEDVWNEWFALLENQPHWIEESGESMILLQAEPIKSALPAFSEVMVGQAVSLGDEQLFITEKGTARITSLEGEFPGKVKPGDQYHFIQGNIHNSLVMIEYYEDEIKLYKGEPFELKGLNAHAT